MRLTMRALEAVLVSGLMCGPAIAVSAAEVAPDVGAAAEAPAPSSHHELLLRAIRERRLLHFSYGGHARVIEPHAYGVSPTGGVVLHGYQTAGGSMSEPPPGWRTFVVANMSEIVVAAVGFSGPRRSYATESLRLDPLWAEISAAKQAKTLE